MAYITIEEIRKLKKTAEDYKVLADFAIDLYINQKDLDPQISKLIDEHFFELL